MREVILKLLEEKGELPPLPDIVLRLQKLLKDRNTNAKTVAGLIEIEPILAGKVLNLSNSVYYSRSAKLIKTLPVAVTKLGFKMIIKLVYSLKLTKLFSDNTVLDSTQFWHHSLEPGTDSQVIGISAETRISVFHEWKNSNDYTASCNYSPANRRAKNRHRG